MLRLRLIEKKHAFFLIAHQFKNDEQWKALGVLILHCFEPI
jgi:hypothetical protein